MKRTDYQIVTKRIKNYIRSYNEGRQACGSNLEIQIECYRVFGIEKNYCLPVAGLKGLGEYNLGNKISVIQKYY